MSFLVEYRMVVFIVGTLFFLKISARALRNHRAHGFYRFFAFEGILTLVCMNLPVWFSDPFSFPQLLSWFLMGTSVLLVLNGLYMLVTRGGSGRKDAMAENYAFENTVQLVETGIYKYIRHPMYSSLFFLNWGVFFKTISFSGFLLAGLVSGALVATALREEAENRSYFGPDYVAYMGRSRMFVPKIF